MIEILIFPFDYIKCLCLECGEGVEVGFLPEVRFSVREDHPFYPASAYQGSCHRNSQFDQWLDANGIRSCNTWFMYERKIVVFLHFLIF